MSKKTPKKTVKPRNFGLTSRLRAMKAGDKEVFDGFTATTVRSVLARLKPEFGAGAFFTTLKSRKTGALSVWRLE